ncbi:MAG TPA: CYTH domain-containing protein [Ignavibacteria bacterium]|nr:CYTH domain-containing protein [Ignavibacteria bacterium]
MKNLEIKSKYDDLKLAAKIAKKLKATYKGVLNQTDTYFNVKSGRLKMRLINNKKYELIHYHRTNSKNARFCNYEIIRLNNGKQVYELLTNALGIKCVIVKKRILYIFENVRIHLDTVKHLGKFFGI